MIIKYLNTSGFLLRSTEHRLLIDPRSKKDGDVDGQYVYVTHRHPDHLGGVNVFLERNPKARLICNFQVAKRFHKYRDRIILAENGKEIKAGPWSLRFVKSRHGAFRGEINYGLIVELNNFRFAHAGDAIEYTGFSKERLDYFAIPIIGFFTTSPKQAINELKKFQSPLPRIIPMHGIVRSFSHFKKLVESEIPDTRCIV
jgi:L-ascorbate metabolism protein UlaG (beta-lactamase superfamily)